MAFPRRTVLGQRPCPCSFRAAPHCLFQAVAHGFGFRAAEQGHPRAVGIGSRGRIPGERNSCLAERATERGWTSPLPAVPREGAARLHAAEEDSPRFQPTAEPTVILACSRAVAHFVVAIAEAGAPVRVFSLKGWHKSAQGNALGTRDPRWFQAVKGRDNGPHCHALLRPFRAST